MIRPNLIVSLHSKAASDLRVKIAGCIGGGDGSRSAGLRPRPGHRAGLSALADAEQVLLAADEYLSAADGRRCEAVFAERVFGHDVEHRVLSDAHPLPAIAQVPTFVAVVAQVVKVAVCGHCNPPAPRSAPKSSRISRNRPGSADLRLFPPETALPPLPQRPAEPPHQGIGSDARKISKNLPPVS